jgi:hypothetical protein
MARSKAATKGGPMVASSSFDISRPDSLEKTGCQLVPHRDAFSICPALLEAPSPTTGRGV